jgi:beta-galactosidase
MGGFVWEWIDHGLRQRDEAGRERFAYGGDFGEVVHDGNFVADGLLFPDRTPSPGLHDLAAVIAQVRFTAEGERLSLTNRYDFLDLSRVVLQWSVEDDGTVVTRGDCAAPLLKPGESTVLDLPGAAASPPAKGTERWLTVRAVTADDLPWATAGHVLSTGQVRLRTAEGAPRPRTTGPRLGTSPRRVGAELLFGDGVFDASTGTLLAFAGFVVDGPRLDLWRAPTDNDRGGSRFPPVAPVWRSVGLHRMQHRTVAIELDGRSLRVETRVAPAGSDLAFDTTYHWSETDGGLRLDVAVTPNAELPCPLPKLGLGLRLPRNLDTVEWFGRGPGEAYADTGYATRVGRFTSTVDGLQIPTVMPQENGRRADVRWVSFLGPTVAESDSMRRQDCQQEWG